MVFGTNKKVKKVVKIYIGFKNYVRSIIICLKSLRNYLTSSIVLNNHYEKTYLLQLIHLIQLLFISLNLNFLLNKILFY